eukprot:scaffold5237_cov170-Ochromonas_danica.AAC.24
MAMHIWNGEAKMNETHERFFNTLDISLPPHHCQMDQFEGRYEEVFVFADRSSGSALRTSWRRSDIGALQATL